MLTARGYFTATLLEDGRVLVAGGDAGQDSFASAEVFDPRTGEWSAVGPMRHARRTHTATRLLDGRVLVTGGTSIGDYHKRSAELFDPVKNTWSDAAPMARGRAWHDAVLLEDGRVLVYGGEPTDVTALAEVYDPRSNTWSAVADGLGPQWGTKLAVLPDGRVLAAGGDHWRTEGGWSEFGPRTELVDVRSGTATRAASLTMARAFPELARLRSGRVLVFGGPFGTRSSSELYDPSEATWRLVGDVVQARDHGEAHAVLRNGRVLVTGGWAHDLYAVPPAGAEWFDEAELRWSALAPPAEHRSFAGMVAMPDGRALLAGGWVGGIGTVATAELFTPGNCD